MELPSWKPEELQNCVPTNNSVLLVLLLVAKLTIQKLFQNVQWLLGAVFEYKQIHFRQYVMVFFVASAKLFAEFPWAWMPFTWIPLQCPHFAVKSSPYPSGLGCIIYCLAGGRLAALRASSRVRTRKLSTEISTGGIKHLTSWWFPVYLVRLVTNKRLLSSIWDHDKSCGYCSVVVRVADSH